MTGVEAQDEAKLIAAAQADPARFLELYDRSFHRVWAFVMRRSASRSDAEDITSEVFRRALEHIKSYQAEGKPFIAWLIRIAANVLADRWSKDGHVSPKPPPDQAGPEDGVERRAVLFQLVERLPEAQRRVIELRYMEGRSLLEAGQELGKTAGAIKQLQRRAIENLRAQLEAANG